MPYKTLDIVWTKPDRGTQPGGLILRKDVGSDCYVTHRFNRLPHTRTPREFYWGHYFSGEDAEEKARADFQKRKLALTEPLVSEGEIIAKGDVSLQIDWEAEG